MFVHRYYSIGLYILVNLYVLWQGQRLGLAIAYPADGEEDIARQNVQNKTPVHSEDKCRPGENVYQGDKLGDWLCDCKPGYIYHPATDQCYPAHTLGPCKPGEYLILQKNKGTPICQPNPCNLDNFVPFRDGCYELDKPGPCKLPELLNVVGINETTFNIICTKDYKLSEYRPNPEDQEEDTTKQNIKNKTLVSLTVRCREGEILYPGDEVGDWVCDCRPAHIYHPKDQKCYQVYTKGPCRQGDHFVLGNGDVLPVCKPKPSQCQAENHVWFRDGCHELGKEGPCKWGDEILNVVGVNETSLEIMCTKDSAINNWPRIARYPEKKCFPGGKRWLLIKNPNEGIFNSFQLQCNYCIEKLNDDSSNNDSSSENQLTENTQTDPKSEKQIIDGNIQSTFITTSS